MASFQSMGGGILLILAGFLFQLLTLGCWSPSWLCGCARKHGVCQVLKAGCSLGEVWSASHSLA